MTIEEHMQQTIRRLTEEIENEEMKSGKLIRHIKTIAAHINNPDPLKGLRLIEEECKEALSSL